MSTYDLPDDVTACLAAAAEALDLDPRVYLAELIRREAVRVAHHRHALFAVYVPCVKPGCVCQVKRPRC